LGKEKGKNGEEINGDGKEEEGKKEEGEREKEVEGHFTPLPLLAEA